MSSDNSNNSGGGRRGSITQSTFGALFNRSSSVNGGTPATPNAPHSNTNPSSAPPRRMSITTLGLNGGGPAPMQSSTPFFANRDRRNSISTADSNSFDESAIEDDEPSDISQSVPTTPFARRKSVGAGAFFSSRGGNSPGTSGSTPTSLYSIPARQRADPPAGGSSAPSASFLPRSASVSKSAVSSSLSKSSSVSSASTISALPASTMFPVVAPIVTTKARTFSDNFGNKGDGLNWSEQFRSRAESAVGHHARPSFGATGSANATSKPMAIHPQGMHERARSVSDMSDPPQQMPERPQEVRGKKTPKWATGGAKPDEVGERILRGEFLMD